jgi:uncharacterized protein (TIGR00730 family)
MDHKIYRPKKLSLEEIKSGCVFIHKGDEDEIGICVMNEELRQGMQVIEQTGPSITFFGSARTKEDDPFYKTARSLGSRVVKELDHAVVTGGGPGIMEAGNRGAYEAGGKSVGFTIKLPFEQETSPYLTIDAPFYYFFTRKAALMMAADAYLVFPGGFGTLDEVFGVLTLIQTRKHNNVPVIFVGVDFWTPLIDFIKSKMRDEEKTISLEDMDLFHILDNEDKIIDVLKNAPHRHDTK